VHHLARNYLLQFQGGLARGALLPLFGESLAKALLAAQFRAFRTHVGVPKGLLAEHTRQQFVDPRRVLVVGVPDVAQILVADILKSAVLLLLL